MNEAVAFGVMPGTEDAQSVFLLSCARVTLVIDSQMVALCNERVAYFSQKESRCSR